MAGKYTELLAVGLIGLSLLPGLVSAPRNWRPIIAFALPVVVVAGYWYLKNWILFGNPIYPFLFAHPGLSDAWMASYMHGMTRPFDPADRGYVTDLLTLRGWHDFGVVLYAKFISQRLAVPVAGAIIVMSLFLHKARIWIPTSFCVILFIVWYGAMFNRIRWAMPAYLLYVSTACIALDRLYAAFLAPRLPIWLGGGMREARSPQ